MIEDVMTSAANEFIEFNALLVEHLLWHLAGMTPENGAHFTFNMQMAPGAGTTSPAEHSHWKPYSIASSTWGAFCAPYG